MNEPRPAIAVYTCIWGRPELTRVILGHYQAMQRRLAPELDLLLFAVGSEGEASRTLCESCGFAYTEWPNRPLGAKWNAGMAAVRASHAQALLVVGSDDLLNDELLRRYGRALRQGSRFVGLREMYFWDLRFRRMFLWKGYPAPREREPIGLGRLIHRDYLERMDWRPWDDELENGLDYSMMCKLHTILEPHELGPDHVLPCGADLAPIDVKSPENLWTFEHVWLQSARVEMVDEAAVLARHYGPEVIEKLLALRRGMVDGNADEDLVERERTLAAGFRPPSLPASALEANRIEPVSIPGGIVVIAPDVPRHGRRARDGRMQAMLQALAAGEGPHGRIVCLSLSPEPADAHILDPLRRRIAFYGSSPDAARLGSALEQLRPGTVMITGLHDPLHLPQIAQAVSEHLTRRPETRFVLDMPVAWPLLLARLTELAEADGPSPDARALLNILGRTYQTLAGAADLLLTDNASTLAFLRQLPAGRPVAFVPHAARVQAPTAGFAQRRNILFWGQFHDPTCQSAAQWLAREVMPLISRQRPDAELHLVGQFGRLTVGDLAGERIKVLDQIPDMDRVLQPYRVFLAPQQTPGELDGFQHMAPSHGLPLVCTPEVAEFLEVRDGSEALIGRDAAHLAEACVAAYSDPALWTRLSSAGLAFAVQHYSRLAVSQTFGQAMASLFASDQQVAPELTPEQLRRVASLENLARHYASQGDHARSARYQDQITAIIRSETGADPRSGRQIG